ncbi:MAG: nicotinate (nicotinamide) nucleotide adenylyltransferase, partial [Victivallales bacterium]|nr:nicotinate (nicotinamide) nucleotide adenylyltransferase [Victivallales bacterium]
FDNDGEGGEGGFKPRRFSEDRPRRRFDDNSEGGEGGFKPRRFSEDRPRRRFDDNGEGGEGGFKSRGFSGERKRFDRPRKRFDDNGEGTEGGFKPRRFSEDRPRRRFDDNGEGGDDFKSRSFSGERRSFDRDGGDFKSRRFPAERKPFDSRVVGRRFDENEEEGEGGFKSRRFSGERKRFGDAPRFGAKPRYGREDRYSRGAEESSAEGEGRRRFSHDDDRQLPEGDSSLRKARILPENETVEGKEAVPVATGDEANQDLAESFATSPANEGDEKPAKEERPAPKPLPFPKARTIAVFGGSFDPIHNGHLMMAEYILARGLADEILFIPSAIPPHKAGTTVATPEQRLEMVRLATAYNEHFSYSDMELRREGKSYSFDTMSLLQKLYPDHKLSFIIGMDSLAQLHSWYRATELVQKVDFIVYPRPNVQPPAYIDLCASFGNRNALRLLNAVLPYHDSVVTYEPSEKEGEPDKRIVTEYDLPSSKLSSTEIRQALADGNNQLLQEALPEAVLNYINENGLYRP